MQHYRFLNLNDGTPCLLRQLAADDWEDVMHLYEDTHSQCPYLRRYADEKTFDPEEEKAYLEETAKSPVALELGAFVDAHLVGSAAVQPVGTTDKVRHRCRIGIAVEESFCSNGIGLALMDGCLRCAREIGYYQAELEVAAENEKAVDLYRKMGFVEFGRNPYAWLTREGQWQEIIHMRVPLRDDM